MLGCNSVPLFCCFHFTPQLPPPVPPNAPATFSLVWTRGLISLVKRIHRTPRSNRSVCKLAITHSFPHTPVQTQPHKQSVCNGASVWVAKQKAPCPPPRHLLCSDVPTVSAIPPLSPPFFFCCRYPTWDLICSLNSYAN